MTQTLHPKGAEPRLGSLMLGPSLKLGARLSNLPPQRRGFTLVELVLVMASIRGRVLEEQAARLLALTEYSRDEAASQGVPVVVWVDPDTRHFGADVKTGFADVACRAKDYPLPADFSCEPGAGAQASNTGGHGFEVAEFEPDGTMDTASVPSVRIANRRRTNGVSIAQTSDGYGYEIVKEAGR